MNEAEGKLSIARQVIPVRGGITVSDPKTDTGIRTIVLPESVARMLKERKKAIGSEWIFPSLRDAEKPINPNTAYGTFKRIIKKAGLPDIPFHGLRHIFSTMALENGLDIKTLSAVLGHSSAETTISVYSHVSGEMERNAAKKMDDAFGTPKPADSPVCDDNHEDGQTPKQEQKTAEFTAKRARSASPAQGVSQRSVKAHGRANIRPAAKTASGNSISSMLRARRSARGN